MSFFNRLRKLRGLNDEIDEELRFHLEEKERRLVADGFSPAEARRQARKAFGSPLAVREHTRDAWVFRWADDLWRDLRFAARGLRRSPGFTTVAVVTLALGIGGCAAMYAFARQVILPSFPYPNRASLAVVESVDRQNPLSTNGITGAAFGLLRDSGHSFASIAGYNADGFLLATDDGVRILEGVLATPDVFEVLGVQPLVGRTFVSENEVVISELTWKKYFKARPELLGSTVELNGKPYVVVGVMPEGFWRERDLWVSLGRTPAQAGRVRTWARLEAAADPAAAQAELDVLSERLSGEDGEASWRLALRDPFALPGGQRSLVGAFVVAPVALVFLIACVNIAHLQLGRDLERGREMALRRALGAGRLRLIRRLLAESFLLATLGGAAAVFVARQGVEAIGLYLPPGVLASVERIRLDGGALLVLMALSAVSTMAIGIVPALRISGLNLTAALKEGGRGQTSRSKFRSLLTTSELALSMMLLVGTGMMGVLAQHVSSIEMGFEEKGLWTARLSLRGQLRGDDARRAWAASALRDIETMPGVLSAAVSTELPFRGGHLRRFEIEGASLEAEYRAVSPDYFATLQAPLRLGRLFAPGDREGSAPAAVVNEAFLRQYLSGRAVGRQLRVDDDLREIVGVVADVRQTADASPAPPIIYVPFRQAPDAPLSLLVRTQSATGSIGRTILERIHAPSDELIVLSAFDFEQEVLAGAQAQRFVPGSMAVFAALGLLLAGVGLYGTTTRAVVQRTQEFGIRQALGARRADILKLVMSESGRGGLAGMAAGLAASFAAARLLLTALEPHERLAFGADQLSRWDLAFASLGAAALLLAVIFFAAYLPARRATHVEPVTALRHD